VAEQLAKITNGDAEALARDLLRLDGQLVEAVTFGAPTRRQPLAQWRFRGRSLPVS
jgi:hypothetical protein